LKDRALSQFQSAKNVPVDLSHGFDGLL